MNTFLRFFYEFISIFFDGLFDVFKGIINGIKQMFNFSEYGKIISSYKDNFNGNEKVFVIMSVIFLAIIIILVLLLIFLIIRKILRKATNHFSKDELLNEIGN